MILALVILVGLIVSGICAACGWTADSRDPEYSVGRLLLPTSRTASTSSAKLIDEAVIED